MYSTCSLKKEQNEDIVQWFLDMHDDAELLAPITESEVPSALATDEFDQDAVDFIVGDDSKVRMHYIRSKLLLIYETNCIRDRWLRS